MVQPSAYLFFLVLLALLEIAFGSFCGRPPNITNGGHTGGKRRYFRTGASIRYYCRSGYRIQGWDYNVCTYVVKGSKTPQWFVSVAPLCIREYRK